MVVLTVTEATALDDRGLVCKGTSEAAGHREPLEFTAHVQDFTDQAVTMTADIVVDRTRFDMTWSPMRIAANDALALSLPGSFAPDATTLRIQNGHPSAMNVPA